jgi:hypothetical protein
MAYQPFSAFPIASAVSTLLSTILATYLCLVLLSHRGGCLSRRNFMLIAALIGISYVNRFLSHINVSSRASRALEPGIEGNYWYLT